MKKKRKMRIFKGKIYCIQEAKHHGLTLEYNVLYICPLK